MLRFSVIISGYQRSIIRYVNYMKRQIVPYCMCTLLRAMPAQLCAIFLGRNVAIDLKRIAFAANNDNRIVSVMICLFRRLIIRFEKQNSSTFCSSGLTVTRLYGVGNRQSYMVCFDNKSNDHFTISQLF